MVEHAYVLPEWLEEIHLFYMMQQYSMLELPYAFKVPALPPWRRKKKIKKLTSEVQYLQDFWPQPAAQVKVEDDKVVKSNAKLYIPKYVVKRLIADAEIAHKSKIKSSRKRDFTFTIGLTQKLLVYLMKNLNCRTVSDLKNREISDNQWKRVTKKVKVPCSCAKRYWYYKLHMQLFCPEPISMKNVVIKLIQHLHEIKERPINWEEIRAAKFDGYTKEFLSQIFELLSEFAKTRINSIRPDVIIDYLYKYYVPVVEKMKNTWIISRLDHILRRIDPVPDLNGNVKHQVQDTYAVIKSYVEPFKDPGIGATR